MNNKFLKMLITILSVTILTVIICYALLSTLKSQNAKQISNNIEETPAENVTTEKGNDDLQTDIWKKLYIIDELDPAEPIAGNSKYTLTFGDESCFLEVSDAETGIYKSKLFNPDKANDIKGIILKGGYTVIDIEKENNILPGPIIRIDGHFDYPEKNGEYTVGDEAKFTNSMFLYLDDIEALNQYMAELEGQCEVVE